jgi:hypothetical protein
MKRFLILPILFLAACNSVYIKPHTMEPNTKVYTESGGYTMTRYIKQTLETRGYLVNVGNLRSFSKRSGEDYKLSVYSLEVPKDVKYIVRVEEKSEKFNPFWCPFNGFWWWNFNVSIADQKTGDEILSWRGRGCANSSVRKLNAILDELEK